MVVIVDSVICVLMVVLELIVGLQVGDVVSYMPCLALEQSVPLTRFNPEAKLL